MKKAIPVLVITAFALISGCLLPGQAKASALPVFLQNHCIAAHPGSTAPVEIPDLIIHREEVPAIHCSISCENVFTLSVIATIDITRFTRKINEVDNPLVSQRKLEIINTTLSSNAP